MVKPGYKQTEIGVIPEVWEVSSLATAFPKLEAGVSVNSDNTLSSEYHILKTSAVHDGVVDIGETKPVVPKDYHRVKCPLTKGSMVISRMNTPALVGECGFVKEAKGGVYLPDRLWQVKNPSESSFDFEWLNYLLNTKQYRDAVRATATGTSNSMKNISKERLLEIKIPYPPIGEQKHIAGILSNLDELIHLVEKQISKKKAIKQGAMQELLTGKKRLPGFSGNWKSYKLNDLLQYEQPTKYIVHSTEYSSQGIPVLTAGKSLLLGYTTETDNTYSNLPVIIFDDFVTSSKFVDFQFKVKSSAMKMLTTRDPAMSLRLIYEMMQMIDFKPFDHQRHWISLFSNFEIKLPQSIDEQMAIDNVLSNMNAEIEALEQKLAKYRQVKQGMMQQLLTGKIRLV